MTNRTPYELNLGARLLLSVLHRLSPGHYVARAFLAGETDEDAVSTTPMEIRTARPPLIREAWQTASHLHDASVSLDGGYLLIHEEVGLPRTGWLWGVRAGAIIPMDAAEAADVLNTAQRRGLDLRNDVVDVHQSWSAQKL